MLLFSRFFLCKQNPPGITNKDAGSHRYRHYKLPVNYVFILVIFHYILILSAVHAEEKKSYPATAIILAFPNQDEETNVFQSIINQSMRFELQRQGFSIVPEDEINKIVNKAPIKRDGSADTISVLKTASRLEAVFVFLALYSGSESNLKIDFLFYSVEEKDFSIHITRQGRVDLAFDRMVSGSISEIISKAGEKIDFVKSTAENSNQEQNTEGSINNQEHPNGEEQAEESFVFKPVEFSLGGGAFFTLGQASQYFTTAFVSSLYGSYLITLSFGYLGLGLNARAYRFSAEGDQTASDNMIIPVGLDVQLKIKNKGSQLGLYVHLSGGAAVLSMAPLGAERLSKLIAYSSAGIGIDWLIGQTFCLNIDTNFTIFFEKEYPIMGYSPTINLKIRL